MNAAARSAKQNIREGYRRDTAGEFARLIKISTASLEELEGDVDDCFEDGLTNFNLTRTSRNQNFTKLRKFSKVISSKNFCSLGKDSTLKVLKRARNGWHKTSEMRILKKIEMEGFQMNSEEYVQASIDYNRIERAIMYLEKNFHKQPGLKEIAESVYLSEYHFQRLFIRWVGISPKRFLQFLTKEYAKDLLEKSKNLLDVAYESGLSSPGRLHDLFVTCEAVTPGEFKTGGEGLTIVYGFHPSPFGECMLALTDRGICGLFFVQDGDGYQALKRLRTKWKRAAISENPEFTRPFINQIFNPVHWTQNRPLHLFLRGTNFQIKVWETLLRIPPATVVSYQDIADYLGMPQASRAVGNAVAQNPIPFVIPCHRVIRKVGDFGNYQSGTARKKAILGWEAAQLEM